MLGVLVEWLRTVCWECWWSGRGLCVGNLGGVVEDCVLKVLVEWLGTVLGVLVEWLRTVCWECWWSG